MWRRSETGVGDVAEGVIGVGGARRPGAHDQMREPIDIFETGGEQLHSCGGDVGDRGSAGLTDRNSLTSLPVSEDVRRRRLRRR